MATDQLCDCGDPGAPHYPCDHSEEYKAGVKAERERMRRVVPGGGVGPLHEAVAEAIIAAHPTATTAPLSTYAPSSAAVWLATADAVLRVVGTQLHAAIVAEFAIEHALARQGVPQHPVTAATCNASLEAERRVFAVVAALLGHPE